MKDVSVLYNASNSDSLSRFKGEFKGLTRDVHGAISYLRGNDIDSKLPFNMPHR